MADDVFFGVIVLAHDEQFLHVERGPLEIYDVRVCLGVGVLDPQILRYSQPWFTSLLWTKSIFIHERLLSNSARWKDSSRTAQRSFISHKRNRIDLTARLGFKDLEPP